MGSHRNKLWATLAVLVAMVTATLGLTGPAHATTARSITTSASPTTAYVGTKVTFSGKVTNSPQGSTVKIQRKSGSSWVTAATTSSSNAAGNYSVKVTLPSTGAIYTYRATAPLTSRLNGVYSRTTTIIVQRHSTITLAVSDPTISTGQETTLSGTVTPFVAGTGIQLQRLDGSTWVSDKTSVVKSNGTYSIKVSPASTRSYRATVPEIGINGPAVSAAKLVTVNVSAPPEILTTTLPEGDKGVAYSQALTKAGGAGTWSISAGLLPAGITQNPSTGLLSGTPTAGGTTNFTVKFAETSTGLSDTQAFTLVVSPPPTITTPTALPNATQGTAYSVTLAKTGRAGTWAVSGLPAGLSVNSGTGEISGTTTAPAGTYGVYPTFTETSTGRTAFKPLSLTVQTGPVNPPEGPTITTTSLPQGDKGVAYSASLAKTGGAGTWTITAGALPAGITVNPTTGTLTGTPTAGGTANFTVTFTETSSALAASKALSIVITPPPTITTTSLPDAVQGAPYSAALNKTGQAGTWSITGLPTGLTLNASTGVISGTTDVAVGDYGVYPTFTETTSGRAVLKPLGLHVSAGPVNPPDGPTITTTSLPQGDKGVAYTTTLTKTGGAGTWSKTSGDLPAGITLNAGTGVLSGTPTAGGTSNFTIRFTETSSSAFATKALSIVVTPPPTITTATLPDAVRGTAYSTTLTKTGQAGTWAITGLPTGLSLNTATGEISGVPTAVVGTYGVYPTYTETNGRTAFKPFALTIGGEALAVTTTSLPDGVTGTAYSKQLTKTGLAGTWAVTKGALPDGITLSAAGLLAGTPTGPGDNGITVTFTETATGFFDNQVLLVHVADPGSPTISTTSLPDAPLGTPYAGQLNATPTGGTWSITYGSLPVGLTLNAATGAITGTPMYAENAIFIVKYTLGSTSNTKVLGINAHPAT